MHEKVLHVAEAIHSSRKSLLDNPRSPSKMAEISQSQSRWSEIMNLRRISKLYPSLVFPYTIQCATLGLMNSKMYINIDHVTGGKTIDGLCFN